MANLNKSTCCGCRVFSGLENFKDPIKVLLDLAPNWFSWKGAFVLFTVPCKNTIGQALLDYIRDNNLGVITATECKKNKKGVEVFAIMWAVNKDAFRAWYPKHGNLLKVGSRVSSLPEISYYVPVGTQGVVTEVSEDWSAANIKWDGGTSLYVAANQLEII